MRASFLPVLAAGVLLADGAMAGTGAPEVRSGTYALETEHAEVLFSVSHFGYSAYFGQFPGATGSLVLNGDDPTTSQLDVTVPVASVWTASAKLTAELTRADWLDAAAFPTMTFHSTKIVSTGPTTADVTGDLTLHGVTKPITLKATFRRAGVFLMNQRYMVGFDAVGQLKRSAFGVSKYAAFGLADTVDLIISAPFERKGP